MIRIHNFRRGARGLRAIWVCEEMGLPYRTIPVDFPPGDAYRSLNPLGSVPLLEDEGIAIGESVAIMLYLVERYGPTPLLPGRNDPSSFARVLEMTVFGEASIGASLNPLLAARFGAPSDHKRNWSVTLLEARVDRFLAHVADRLADNAYLVGSGLTLADISVMTAIQIWQGALGKAIPERLLAYMERLKGLPAYQRAVQANT
jgi:glutathione S-transferase